MQKEDLEKVANIAADAALAKQDSIIKSKFASRYRDAERILKNYRRLKAHYSNSEETASCGLTMSQIEKMLAMYKALCNQAASPDELRRWNAIYLRYISNENISTDDIAERLFIDKRTFYRDIKRATEDLAVVLFGIEAMGNWKYRK